AYGAGETASSTVIASEAKQSMAPQVEAWIASSLSLLAMTARPAAIASHRRAQYPGRELSAAEGKALALGRLAGSGFQHQVEDALAAFLHALLAVEDGAAIDVHVVFHPLVHRRVGGELDGRRRLAAEHAAAAGGEADEIGAACHLPGRSDRVVAGRVHEHKALLGARLRIMPHIAHPPPPS